MNKQGKLTPSGFADMMTNDRSGKGLGKTAMAYAQRVALERLGVEVPEITGWALEHGILNEPHAIEAYEQKTGSVVIQPLPIQHPEVDYVAGTPDGLIGDDGIVEIKCPYNPINHLANLTTGEQLNHYKWQIQGYLWITGRKWCDFVSYDQRFPEHLRMYIKRVDRDDMMIADIAERAEKFEELVQSIVNGTDLLV